MLQLASPWLQKSFPTGQAWLLLALVPSPRVKRRRKRTNCLPRGGYNRKSSRILSVYWVYSLGHVTTLLPETFGRSAWLGVPIKLAGACDLKCTHPLRPKPNFLFLCYTSSIVEVFEKFEEKKSCGVSVHRRHGCLGLATKHNLISSFDNLTEGCSICRGCVVLAAALFWLWPSSLNA